MWPGPPKPGTVHQVARFFAPKWNPQSNNFSTMEARKLLARSQKAAGDVFSQPSVLVTNVATTIIVLWVKQNYLGRVGYFNGSKVIKLMVRYHLERDTLASRLDPGFSGWGRPVVDKFTNVRRRITNQGLRILISFLIFFSPSLWCSALKTTMKTLCLHHPNAAPMEHVLEDINVCILNVL